MFVSTPDAEWRDRYGYTYDEYVESYDPSPQEQGGSYSQPLDLDREAWLEQRPRVNPILVGVREWDIDPQLALDTLNGYSLTHTAIPEHHDHARRVLTRLAALAVSA
jgi:hypothetical protein